MESEKKGYYTLRQVLEKAVGFENDSARFYRDMKTKTAEPKSLDLLHLEVEGLLQMLVNSSGSGLLQRLSPPLYKPDGSWNTVKEGKRTKTEIAALYNYKYVLEDRSRGIHNAKYAIQILYDAIESLKPGFDVTKRPN